VKKPEMTYLNIAILVSVVVLAIAISPFLSTLILAAILVTSTTPIHNWVLTKVKGRQRLAAAIMALSIGIIFSVGFFVFFISLSREAVSTYQSFDQLLREGKLNIQDLISKISRAIGIRPTDVIASVIQAAQTASGILVEQSTNLLKSIGWLFLNFFILVFSMFFFFKDGRSFINLILKVSPLPERYSHEILDKFKQVSLAMMYGIFLTALAQGVLGGVGLGLAGIRNPIFWGTAMGILGMLPIGGSAFIWLPAGLFLIFTDHYVAGPSLLLWGALIVASVDNVIKPMVISQQAKIYPLATFIVVIGGLLVFGLKGAMIAPMVLALLVALIHIRKRERLHEPRDSAALEEDRLRT